MLMVTSFLAPLPCTRDPGVRVHTDVSACTPRLCPTVHPGRRRGGSRDL